MTRAEFIAYWIGNYGRGEATPDGLGVVVSWAGEQQHWLALECACPEEGCKGWAMVPVNLVEHHMRFYAPAHLRPKADSPGVK